jgi:hypothetical protein
MNRLIFRTSEGTPLNRPWLIGDSCRLVLIVFTNVSDPVGAGFVDSLAQPGGIATGSCTFSLFAQPSRGGAKERTRRGQRVATTIAGASPRVLPV